MGNKNTRRRLRQNPVSTGTESVISRNFSRNMELAIVRGRTFYRPINPALPSRPVRGEAMNRTRRNRGHLIGTTVPGANRPPAKAPQPVAPAGEPGLDQAA